MLPGERYVGSVTPCRSPHPELFLLNVQQPNCTTDLCCGRPCPSKTRANDSSLFNLGYCQTDSALALVSRSTEPARPRQTMPSCGEPALKESSEATQRTPFQDGAMKAMSRTIRRRILPGTLQRGTVSGRLTIEGYL